MNNDELMKRYEIEDVVSRVVRRRIVWIVHMDKMTDDRVALITKKGIHNSTKLSVRPPKRWKESWTWAPQE